MKKARRIEFIFEITRIVMAMAIAYGLSLFVLAIVTDDPAEAVRLFALGPFTSIRRFGMLVIKMTPYMLTGAGMCFIYAANRFSMVGEGAYMFSGCLTAALAIAATNADIPHVLLVAALLLAATVAGAVMGSVPAVLREKLGANEVVISIMMNYILMYMSVRILKIYLRDPQISYLGSKIIPENAKLTQIVRGSSIHSGLIIAFAAVVLVGIIFYLTPLGVSIRISGTNPHFAKYSGLPVARNMIIAQILGAALCGLGGGVDILGVYDRYLWIVSPQYGFDGLLVAVLARKNPWFVPLGAFLLAYMRTGASILNVNTEVPLEFVQVAQSLIILLIAAENFLGGFKNKAIIASTSKKEHRKTEASA